MSDKVAKREQALAQLDRIEAALAQVDTAFDAVKLAKGANVLRSLVREGDLGQDAANKALAITLRTRRRAGELIPEEVGGRRDRKSKTQRAFSTLKDLGLEDTASARWQQLARLPKKNFEEFIAAILADTHGELSLANAWLRWAADADVDSPPMAKGRFGVIYADPPWQYEHIATLSRALENQYLTMELEDICKLEIPADDNTVLFLWATSPKLAEAMQVVEAWGFSYRTSLVWVKDKIGMGYYARQQHELLLVAAKGKPSVPAESDRPPSVITAPRGKHTDKPEVVYELIERMYPDVSKIELFARRARPGWKVWPEEPFA